MEELYVENFATQDRKVELVVKPVSSNSALESQNAPKASSDIILDMVTFLDRLEKEIEKEYFDFDDYQFIFEEIRVALKNRSIEGVPELLDELEELLDLGLPSIILKKGIEGS